MGSDLELTVGPPGHGGFCVAREGDLPEGRVVFVRHALPGERVRARVTEDAGRYLRADAVEILDASPDRVEPPCPHAGPGRCGGCDWQHADPAAQRALKAAVIAEQFARLARLEVDVTVEPLPGGSLGWRTRTSYAVGPDGAAGLRRHRLHEVEPLARCPLGVPGVGDSAALAQPWPGLSGLEVAVGDDGEPAWLAHRPAPPRRGRGRRAPDRIELVEGPARLRHRVGEHELTVEAGGFWQVHPHALPVLTAALLDALALQPGERVLELFAGAGALTVALADAVGPTGRVLGIESSRAAVADAAANLAAAPQAEVRHGRIDAATTFDLAPDVVVLDPPRAGAGPAVLAALAAAGPRAIGYLSCDPATLARDVRAALDAGWALRRLRGFDAFPMTHHVECLALLTPS